MAWRAQLMGWRCLYTPSAVGHHVRTVTPAEPRLRAGVHQYAFGEEPLPDAHQERDAGPLPPVLAAHDDARPGGDGRRDILGAGLASGILARGEVPARAL